MGINDRKDRDKEDLKKKILTAARELFLVKGFENTSIRNIAEKIEYSPTSIYLHFKDKDDLFHALHSEGFELLNAQFSTLHAVRDPFERLIAMGRIYMQFAVENPELYELMFIHTAPIDSLDMHKGEEWLEGKTSFEGLTMTIEGCIQAGYFKFPNTEVAAYMIWSFMHGMISLKICHRCAKVLSEVNQEDILPKSFDAFVTMLEQLRSS
ncbi:MAG: TetR/AcrR family transcriptional regulator [Saprospiraceae bacterium]